MLGAGCAIAPISPVKMTLLPGRTFVGPRELFITGDEQLITNIEWHLREKGFKVARALPGVIVSPLPSRYVVTIKGVCWSDADPADRLHLEIFDSKGSEQLFTAKVVDWRQCPTAFSREVVDTIVGLWEPVTAAPTQKPVTSEL